MWRARNLAGTTDSDGGVRPLFSRTTTATQELYQAARQQSPISVMFQLGEVDGQLMGVYLRSVIPEVPEFDDGENRLQWRFRGVRAQGTVDDEIAVGFGISAQWHFRRQRYESEAVVESKVVPGVRFKMARMSFGRRVELMRRVRELARRSSFWRRAKCRREDGRGLLRAEIERMYLLWGL